MQANYSDIYLLPLPKKNLTKYKKWPPLLVK